MAKISSIDSIRPVVGAIVQQKKEMAWHAINGNCKKYKEASRAYSKLAVDNFELATKIPGIEIKGKKLPFRIQLNMIKIMLFNLFRKKSPEEKQFKQMVKEYRAKQYIKSNMP